MVQSPLSDDAWKGADFRRWREVLRLRQDQAAKLLGVSRRTVINWETGDTELPVMAALACHYLADHLDIVQARLTDT